jgi:uncharacterized DUF497 family protein
MSEQIIQDLFARIRAFEWDEQKRQVNLRQHNIDFRDAQRVIDEPNFIRRSDRKGEIRFVVYGFVDALEVVVICTFRGEHCRLVSARRARKDERRKYHSRLPRRSEAGED